MRRACVKAVLVLLILGSAASAFAVAPILRAARTSTVLATADVSADRIAKLEQQVADAKGSADNAWMLMSAALVLMMTGPGLALFYGGLVRKKNVLGTMMQSFAMMAIITVLWAIVGYSLRFAPGNSFHRRPEPRFSARRRRAARRGLRRHHPAADLHDLPVDVRHHHSGADHRRLCRAHEVQRHGAVHGAVVAVGLLRRWRTWSGARAAC